MNIGNQTGYSIPREAAALSGTAALISTGNSSSNTSLDHTLLFFPGHITLLARRRSLIALTELSLHPARTIQGCSRHCSACEPHAAVCCRGQPLASNLLSGCLVTLAIHRGVLC